MFHIIPGEAMRGNLREKLLLAAMFLWGGIFVSTAYGSDHVYYFHNDHLGTPQAMTDSAGRVVWKAEYDPFGKAEVDQDPDGNGQLVVSNLRFPGQYYDAETGLHYNWNRYYDPNLGRYLQPDPIGLDGGLNLYSYVFNNPINATDPRGLQAWIPAAEAFAIEAEAFFIRLSQTPAAQRAALMVSQLGNQFISKLDRLFSKYPLDAQKCDKLAEGVYKVFQKAGANPQIIEITDKLNRPYFVTDTKVVFSSNSVHRAVRVGDMVYDGITKVNGMPYNEYINTLTTYGIYPVERIVK